MIDDVRQLYPPISDVRKIDELLVKRWNLNFFESIYSYHDRFSHLDTTIRRYFRLCERHQRKISAGRPADETEIFKLLANEDVFAAVGSRRRRFILDGCAMAAGTIRRFGLKGAVLDAGCHVGTTIDVLRHFFPNSFVGIDPVGPAIATAKRKSANSQNVSYIRAALPWQGETLFELVLSLDVLSHVPTEDHETVIASLGQNLTSGGFLIIVSKKFQEVTWVKEIKPIFLKNHLGFVTCDVNGGYGDVPPDLAAVIAVLFRKGDLNPLPEDVMARATMQWQNYFLPYANSPMTPDREKTQAFERAQRAENSS
jgi:2-polyprenyl-3-methyl-5-hydroxy-6-metoxy-1,4-benzoquinol methylase